MNTKRVRNRGCQLADFRIFWSVATYTSIVAACLITSIGIPSAFSAPDEVTAQAASAGLHRHPDRTNPPPAFRSSEAGKHDPDLAWLLAWHASASNVYESAYEVFASAILAPD
ncbi:MAG: hypothetical protein ABI771_02430 [Betaproteobacteria bacterium]